MEDHLGPFYRSLKKNARNCIILDSRPETEKAKTGGDTVDGVHRKSPGASAWADQVVKDFYQIKN